MLTRSHLSVILLAALAVPLSLAACRGPGESVCERVPDDVLARTPPSLPAPEEFSIVFLRTEERGFTNSLGDCEVRYQFVVGGIGAVISPPGVYPPPQGPEVAMHFSTTAAVDGSVYRLEHDRLLLTIYVPQTEPAGEYEAAFQHPDGRRVETRFRHYGFK
jgi:hypothetical protein